MFETIKNWFRRRPVAKPKYECHTRSLTPVLNNKAHTVTRHVMHELMVDEAHYDRVYDVVRKSLADYGHWKLREVPGPVINVEESEPWEIYCDEYPFNPIHRDGTPGFRTKVKHTPECGGRCGLEL